MENEIKGLQNYFTDKMLAGEFEVVEMQEHTMDILIDGKYNFSIWTANAPENTIPYHGHGDFRHYFIFTEFTEKQALEMDKIVQGIKQSHEVLLSL